MLYQVAADAVTKIRAKQGSVKSVVLGGTYKKKKQLYALVCETLKYHHVLEQILAKSGICKKESLLRKPELGCVLLYDFLFGKGITAAPKLKNVIDKHKTALRAELARIKIKQGVSRNSELIKDNAEVTIIPRYVRVNTLKISVQDAISHYRSKGYSYLESPDSYTNYILFLKNLKTFCFLKDFHIEHLLVFHARSDFHEDDLYQNGSVILQDKASCVPATILNPPPGSTVIDCCAAPGNKTSQIAALMGGNGKIFAFERNGKRAATLQSQLSKAGVKCSQVIHKDFLSVKPDDEAYCEVSHVLVDPSCSGSGIVNRMDALADGTETKSADRIKSLSNFQAKILKQALSFPNVRQVVYSTCSVHVEENEKVVEDVLEQLKDVFKLVDIDRSYTTRGLDETTFGEVCLRFRPEVDLTNGFFVALFERIEKSEECIIVRKKSEKKSCKHLQKTERSRNTLQNTNHMLTGRSKKKKIKLKESTA